MKGKEDYRLFLHLIEYIPELTKFEPDEHDGVYYPTRKLIIDLHGFLINCFKQEGDVAVNPGLYTDSDLEFTGIKYYESSLINKYDNIIHKGAEIFSLFLDKGHPFTDGNKRTGFVTLWVFLLMNGYNIRFDYYNYERHLEKIVRWADADISADKLSEIKDWIYNNSTLYMKIKRNLYECKTKILLSLR
jgi:prophage maintenance system killer protein